MNLNILLVDDNKTVRGMIRRQLQEWGYSAEEAASGREAMEMLVRLAGSDRRPNIALVDWNMPDMNGIALCKWIKGFAAYQQGPHLYVLFLTVNDGSENQTVAFKAGADGYVVKGSVDELEAKLNAVKERVLEEYELRNTISSLQKDPSGVLVRREIIDRLGRHATETHQSPLGIVLLDVNDFKKINDQYGHLVGDQILEAVGRRLQDSVRDGNVGRYGGDEFLVGLPGCDSITTEKRAIGIAARLTADPISTTAGEIRISICYGTAANEDLANLDSLIEIADKALYEQKNSRKKVPNLSPF
ncbi:MAG TPA: diguanylate cyclase [Acidobacteriota bacterium]|nr:diguanylate cyclase [Acidobacteriota bacterium]